MTKDESCRAKDSEKKDQRLLCASERERERKARVEQGKVKMVEDM